MKFAIGFVAGFVAAPTLIVIGINKMLGTNLAKDAVRSVSRGFVTGILEGPGVSNVSPMQRRPYRRYSSAS